MNVKQSVTAAKYHWWQVITQAANNLENTALTMLGMGVISLLNI